MMLQVTNLLLLGVDSVSECIYELLVGVGVCLLHVIFEWFHNLNMM